MELANGQNSSKPFLNDLIRKVLNSTTRLFYIVLHFFYLTALFRCGCFSLPNFNPKPVSRCCCQCSCDWLLQELEVRPLFAWAVQHGELAAARTLCRAELCGVLGQQMEGQLAELLEANSISLGRRQRRKLGEVTEVSREPQEPEARSVLVAFKWIYELLMSW